MSRARAGMLTWAGMLHRQLTKSFVHFLTECNGVILRSGVTHENDHASIIAYAEYLRSSLE